MPTTWRGRYKKIAQRLNDQRIPSPKGGRWALTTVRDLLLNPVYRGAFRWDYRTKAKFHRIIKDGVERIRQRDGVYGSRSSPDVYLKEGMFPAIVTPQLWHQAQQVRAARQHNG